jgi:starch synthase
MPENKKRPGGRTSPTPAPTGRSKNKSSPPVENPKPEAPAVKDAVKPRGATTAKSPAAASKPTPPVPSTKTSGPPLSILMVASEAHPYAKTGGLAEVAAALPDALGRLGHHVTLVLPRYRGIDLSAARSQATMMMMGSQVQRVSFHAREERPGVTVVFVDVPELFDRAGGLYNVDGADYPDNGWRFAVFSRAALEYARLRGQRPSIIHANDWQTGLVPVYQKMHFSPDPIVGGVPAIFTIHNLAFQGVYPPSMLPILGFGPELLDIQALEYWGHISYLKGGVNFSERLTTVSPTYAREILTPEFGFGFDGILRRRADALSGILNGIDVERWNPEADEFIGASYTRSNIAGKRQAKRVLLETAGFPSGDDALERPVIGLISRLTYQKGFDLIAAAIDELMQLDVSWVMLGSGDRAYEEMWRGLAIRYPNRVATTIGFNELLAHRIEAGADLFLMPSRYEPCGLNQMYSLRYGTLPIVRATGGLEDTVKDASEPGANGFKFSGFSASELVATVRRALELFRNPKQWKQFQQNGMKQDFSWDASAREYVKVYEAALTAAQTRP